MLELRGISKRYGDTIVLREVSWSLGPGEVAVLRGPSGAGKTTLLRLIAGLEVPDAGEIWLDGAMVSRPGLLIPPYQRKVAVVFQEPRLWPHMTVRENVMFALAELPAPAREERFNAIARRTGTLEFAARYPAELSVGQARRVALARALAPQRALVLMDEPLTNLDDAARTELSDMVRSIRADEQFALLYVTHDAAEQVAFASTVATLSDGALVRESHPSAREDLAH